ncbi:hypothetical protein NBZ79_00980 [Sneathiella marina]|uniref:Uncharacterized protein n=1 Tax=Sneathiella marina TaxID=2950108 RepID=A0ABY4W8F4_9PROT|nr:hypothetical protein [Sneathiella marina]USG61549.1 hypothetical protein NBZ79_00980 [Sneathiella marina]
MQNISDHLITEPTFETSTYADPIISAEGVKWAARRFILLYGDDAPIKALEHVNRLDARGKLRTAEMFARVERECSRLLKKSEKFRQFTIN